MNNNAIKILIIDDIIDNIKVLKALIKEEFTEAIVLTALSGKPGLELAKSIEPDMIFLDIVMPNMDGYEVCRRLKKDESLSEIPVVFITASKGVAESRIIALEVGAEAFLSKPIDKSELIAQIRAMYKLRLSNIQKRDEKKHLQLLVDERTKELLQSKEAIQKSKEELDLLMNSTANGIYGVDVHGICTFVNKAVLRLLGYDQENELLGKKIHQLIHHTHQDGTPFLLEDCFLMKSFHDGVLVNQDDIIWRKDGTFFPVNYLSAPKLKDGEIVGTVVSFKDISEVNKLINDLKTSEQNLDMFFQQSLTGFFIMMLDQPVYWNDTVNKEEVLDYIFDHQKCIRVNQAMLDQYNLNLDEYLDMTPRKMFAHDINHGKDAWRQMLDNRFIHIITDEKKADGTQMFIEGDYICMYDALGRFIGHFGNQEDVTLRIQKQKEIEYLSNHDFLTDLYNRRYYFEQYKNFDDARFYPLGVMMIDVNGLKIINDAFGHAVGDKALKTIGSVLKETFEPKDVVSRIGGDEFAILIPKVSVEELQNYKDRLKETVKKRKIENVELSLAVGYEAKTNPDKDIDELLKLAENRMYRHKSTEGSSVRNRAITAILQTLTDKYQTERRHSIEVSRLCKLIGTEMKLREDELKGLDQAGMFHDIGKISVPDSILNKPGKLTDEEYDIIKTHTEVGYQILRAADEYSDLAIHALHHHERWDGKGYPSGIKGNDIPLFSRIICVVDAYEAMTADRPYRKRLSEEFAISEIIKCSGSQFDPNIAQIFIEKVLKGTWS